MKGNKYPCRISDREQIAGLLDHHRTGAHHILLAKRHNGRRMQSQSGGNRAFLPLNEHSVIGFEDPKSPIKFQRLFITVLSGSQHFASGHGRHVVRHTIRKHQPTLLDDDVKLMDHPPSV
ncbi:MAG TPA: hypothetical protein VN666_04935 [Nitrospira sp.]|nr:hypothetical protein [Nitrospira sp.]